MIERLFDSVKGHIDPWPAHANDRPASAGPEITQKSILIRRNRISGSGVYTDT